jgi:hypothetical protein
MKSDCETCEALKVSRKIKFSRAKGWKFKKLLKNLTAFKI